MQKLLKIAHQNLCKNDFDHYELVFCFKCVVMMIIIQIINNILKLYKVFI